MSKIYKNAQDALKDLVFDGMKIMSPGFGLCGIPENSFAAIKEIGVKNLHVIAGTCGVADFGLGVLISNDQVTELTTAYMGENSAITERFLSGALKVNFTPMGILSEKIRAGGCGVPAFYSNVGIGTVVEEGKEKKEFDGKTYILETALKGDVSIIKAWKADEEGNLVYRKATRNFNPEMATASKYTVVEVEEIVPCGQLNPDEIHTPGIYVDRIYQGKFEKRIERLTVRKREAVA